MSEIQTAIVAATETDFMPAMTIQQAIQRRGALVDFVKAVMVKDTDFGVIPGTGTKPTLLNLGPKSCVRCSGCRPPSWSCPVTSTTPVSGTRASHTSTTSIGVT